MSPNRYTVAPNGSYSISQQFEHISFETLEQSDVLVKLSDTWGYMSLPSFYCSTVDPEFIPVCHHEGRSNALISVQRSEQ